MRQVFIHGFQATGRPYFRLNRQFVERILEFCADCRADLRAAQAEVAASGGPHYPMMKLVDMYFWQVGYELAAPAAQ